MRAQTVSRDGTEIGWWTTGQGPPLVLVHGAPADHTRFAPLLPYLEPRFTLHALDRRGRGASGDASAYAFEREFEDVAAVVDAVAAESGTSVALYGHSLGGVCAFGGAALTRNVRRLVLYEGWPAADTRTAALPDGLEERLGELLAQGDRDGVVATVFRELAGASDEELEELRALPSWEVRKAVAHTLPRELRGAAETLLDGATAARITAPALLLAGAESGDPGTRDVEAVAAALPDARIEVLGGLPHAGDILRPEVVAERLAAFVLGD